MVVGWAAQLESELGARGWIVSPTFAVEDWRVMLRGEEQEAKPTSFQLACMTLPYSQFPLARALKGIKSAGYRYVAWGTSHREQPGDQKRTPVMATDAPPAKAKDLGKRCRDEGLEPVMMFSTIYPEHKDAMRVFTSRIRQAQAAGIGQVLTFGHTRGGNHVHSIWHNPADSFGEDLLRRHLEGDH